MIALSCEPHPMELTAPRCPFSSTTGLPGLRISRICTSGESEWNVARKFASRGLNAILSRLAVGPRLAAAAVATLLPPLPRPGVGFAIGLDLEGVSYRIVECSRLRRSNARRDPSAPTETKESTDPGAHATSYTSRSCAMSCVTAVEAERSQTVHVVSIEDVTIRLGLTVFHEKDVRGAVVGFGFLDYQVTKTGLGVISGAWTIKHAK